MPRERSACASRISGGLAASPTSASPRLGAPGRPSRANAEPLCYPRPGARPWARIGTAHDGSSDARLGRTARTRCPSVAHIGVASPVSTGAALSGERGTVVPSSAWGVGCCTKTQHPRRLGLCVGRCSRLKRAALNLAARPVGRLARPAGRPRPAEGCASPSALSASPLCCPWPQPKAAAALPARPECPSRLAQAPTASSRPSSTQ